MQTHLCPELDSSDGKPPMRSPLPKLFLSSRHATLEWEGQQRVSDIGEDHRQLIETVGSAPIAMVLRTRAPRQPDRGRQRGLLRPHRLSESEIVGRIAASSRRPHPAAATEQIRHRSAPRSGSVDIPTIAATGQPPPRRHDSACSARMERSRFPRLASRSRRSRRRSTGQAPTDALLRVATLRPAAGGAGTHGPGPAQQADRLGP